MGRYEQLAQDFYERYEEPKLEELTVGFSDIDPPLKVDLSDLDHEELEGLLGGSPEGHYHLTKDLWLAVIRLLDERDFDGGFASTSEAEYNLNVEDWFDGGDASVTYGEYLENVEKWADGGDANG